MVWVSETETSCCTSESYKAVSLPMAKMMESESTIRLRERPCKDESKPRLESK